MASEEDRTPLRIISESLSWETLEAISPSEVKQLEGRIATALTTARAEGEAVGLGWAAKVADVCTCGSGPEFRAVNMRYHATGCLMHIATMIRALSPDPSFLSRREDAVRAETWKEAIKAAHANLNASSSGTADYVSGFANGVLSGAQQTIKALETAAGSKTKISFGNEEQSV